MEAVAIISIASVLLWFIIDAKNQSKPNDFNEQELKDEDKK